MVKVVAAAVKRSARTRDSMESRKEHPSVINIETCSRESGFLY